MIVDPQIPSILIHSLILVYPLILLILVQTS